MHTSFSSALAPLLMPVMAPDGARISPVDHAAGASVALATLDAQGSIVAAGGALAELTGATVTELVQREFASLFTIDDTASLLLAFDRCLSGIASWISVRLAQRRNVTGVWVRLEPMVAAASGSATRIGVAVVCAPASWRPPSPVEISPPLRAEIDDLRSGLADGQFRVHYHPILDLRRPRVVGVEALLRWQHPQAGLRMPADFLPIAEAAGLTGELTAYVLREACEQAARWPEWRMAVNLFHADLRSACIVDRVTAALDAASLPADRLSLEMTEQSLVSNVGETVGLLEDLRGLGVRLALDDFGTGHSSLLYLRDFPVTELKVDRTFVAGLAGSGDDRAIVSSILSLAVTLGLEVVAVGVETEQQLSQLRLLGCEFGQGFLFSSPLSAAEVDAVYAEPSGFLARSALAHDVSSGPVSLSQVTGIGNDPVTATIIRLQHKGASLHTIAAALNQTSQRTPDGKRWTATAVAALIHELTVRGRYDAHDDRAAQG